MRVQFRILALLSAVLLGAFGGLSVEAAANEPPAYAIVITAERIGANLAVAPGAIETITAAELVQSGALTVGDALKLAAGISIGDYGAYGSPQRMGARGTLRDHVAVVLDGTPVGASSGLVSLAHMPVTDIHRIEIVKGPGAAWSGGGTAGGVVYVETIAAARAAADPGRASTLTREGVGQIGVTARDAGVAAGADYRVTAQLVDGIGITPEGDRADRYFQLRLDREFSARSEGNVHVTWISTEIGGSRGSDVPGSGALSFDSHFGADASYLYDLPNGYLETSLYAFQSQRLRDDGFETRREGTTVGTQVEGHFALGAGNLVVGASVAGETLESDGLVGGPHRSEYGALYAQVVQPLGEQTSVSVGARSENYPEYAGAVSPRVGVEFQAASDTRLRASAGHSYRPPSLDDRFRADVGDAGLTPESGWSYEVGVNRALAWGAVDVAVFRREMENLIHWSPDGGGTVRPHNVAQSVSNGVDFTLSAPVVSGLMTTLRWTLQSAEDATTGQALAFVPANEARVGLHYASALTRANVELQYQGAKPDGMGGEIAANTMLNGRVSRVAGRNVNVFAEGTNLLGSAASELEEQWVSVPAPSVWLGAALSF